MIILSLLVFVFITDAYENPSSTFVSLSDIAHTLNEIGIGANNEPELVRNLSMYSRIFITAMILNDVGVNSLASRFDLMNCYINFLMEIRMDGEAETITQTKTDNLLDELLCGGIVFGGRFASGGRKIFNRDSPVEKVSIEPCAFIYITNL